MQLPLSARRLGAAALVASVSLGLPAAAVAEPAAPAAVPAATAPPAAVPAPGGASASGLSPVGGASPEPPASAPPGALQTIGRTVTVTSDRSAVPAALVSQPTFTIDRARIDAYGARTVADALAAVPGVTLFGYGGFGQQVDYGIRGASPAQTLVLVDGIPVTDPTTGTVEIAQLSTVGVDRIEVVESGASTLYGTNAAGGVINVITRVPRATYLELSDGSYADRDVRVGGGNGIVGATLERHVATDAYAYPALAYSRSAPGDASAVAYPAGVRANAYAMESAGRLSLDAPLAAGLNVRGRADVGGTQIGVPGSLAYLSAGATQGIATRSVQLGLERATSRNVASVIVQGSGTRLDYVDPTYGESDVYTGRSQLSLKDAYTGKRVDVLAGVDLSRESGAFGFATQPATPASDGYPGSAEVPAYGLGATRSQSAAYVQLASSPAAGTRFTAGLRAEHDAPYGSVLAPSFGGVVRSGVVRFSGDVGESYRVPTLQDLYYPGASNPLLQPERAQTADVTVAYDAPLASLSAGWFDRNGSNFIVFDPVAFVPVNAQRASTAGVQIAASSRPLGGIVTELSFTSLYRALDLTTGGRLPRNPNGTATLNLTKPFGRERLSYGARWTIVGSDGDDASHATPLAGEYDAYDALDGFVRYKLAPQTVLTVRGFDLGNERYAPVFGYPALGRRVYVELSTR